MALFDSLPSFDTTNFLSDFGLSDIFGTTPSSSDLLNFGTTALQQFGLTSETGQPISGTPVMAAVPMIGRAGAVVARSFFNRFPNLAVALQGLRNAGKKVTRANLYSLMKRFGPDFLITGGILSAAAVSELAMAGPGRRRMNPGNVKALRRAHRRMKSFHHICATNDHLLSHRRRSTRKIGSTSQTITAVRA
jgi:hypothetical protein